MFVWSMGLFHFVIFFFFFFFFFSGFVLFGFRKLEFLEFESHLRLLARV
jgi:hypothetical protein